MTAYDLVLTATDESGTMTTLAVHIPDPYANDNSDDKEDDTSIESGEEGLPALSMMATLSISLLGAAFAGRGRRE
jgi:hypothetical protein